MLQGLVSTAVVVGTLLTAMMPATGLARDRDDFRGRRGESRFSRGRSFVSPRGYYGRGYAAPRSYGRPVYSRRYNNGGFYLGFGAPYGYAYDPGYVYQAPLPQSYPQYAEPQGSYDPNQQQYQQGYPHYQQQPEYQPQGSYDPNQQQYQPGNPQYQEPQYQQPQQNYDPNQQQYQQGYPQYQQPPQQGYPNQQPYPQQRYQPPQEYRR